MENISQDMVIRQSLLNSIDREELLVKKYDEYNKYIEDTDTKDMLNEFQETAKEHIALLKDKLVKLKV